MRALKLIAMILPPPGTPKGVEKCKKKVYQKEVQVIFANMV